MGSRAQDELFRTSRSGARGGRGLDNLDVEAAEDDVFLRKKQIEEQQDEHLDAIHASLSRVGQAAQGLNNELRWQNDMLDTVGQDMGRTNAAMKLVESKTADLVKQAGGQGYFCIILVLGTVAFILFLMIIYT